ncbi:MAG TPA: M36 family metallopeptidase [Stellaceae bacterium]|nr:M36 family metallopeptidase [Stellaceae bacterium]
MVSLLDKAEIVLDPSRTRPIKVQGTFALTVGASLADSVKSFLAAHSADLSLPFGAAGLTLVKEVSAAGHRVLRYNHTIDGIRVFGAQLIVTVDTAQQVRNLEIYAGPTRVLLPPQDAKLLSAQQAFDAAAASLGGYSKRLDPPAPESIWFPTDQGVVRAFEVIIPTAGPAHDWQMVVDAQTGAILLKRDLIKEMASGTGLVFDPNPVVTANNNTYRDPAATAATCGFTGTTAATLDAQRVSRTLLDLTVSAGNYTLKGPWCEIHDFAAPAGPNPTEASGNFNYGSTDSRFNAVMVYYHIDTFQRYLQSIGIANAHASPIRCDPLDDSIISAWFSPVDLGLHFSDSGNCRPDRATDADCIIHEYQHAIQNDLVPGWGGTNPVTHRDEADAMGEGAGDFVACVYFADRGGGYQREVFEDWVFGLPPSGGPPTGLRRVDGTKIYPGSWVGEVHSDGEIWSAALWNIYRAIGGDVSGPSALSVHEAARRAMLKSLFESYPLLATTASMPDGAEALMRSNAALDEYRGQHLREMLQSFYDRGILAVDAAADLFIRDDPSDPGTTTYHSPTFYDSQDIWIRNADDGGTTHQQPITGRDNWFYARVRNRGSASARAFVVTFNVKLWLGTEFIYPGDFVPFISAVPSFNLAPGGDVVVKAKWPSTLVPPAHAHGCVLVSVFSPLEPIPVGAHVWEHGNLAQKNIVVQQAAAGDTVTVRFRFGSTLRPRAELAMLELNTASARLALLLAAHPSVLKEIVAAASLPPSRTAPNAVTPGIQLLDATRVAVAQPGRTGPLVLHLAPGSAMALGASSAAPFAVQLPLPWSSAQLVTDAAGVIIALSFAPARVVRLPVHLPARTDIEFELKVKIPSDARTGESEIVDVVQRNVAGTVVGGIRVMIVVR